MKTEWRIFGIVSAFLLLASVAYAIWTNGSMGQVEWIGTIALILSGLLCLMSGGYFWFVSRRIDLRPEDRGDAEISEGAGEVGFFSPGSYWPFGIGVAVLTTGIGLVYLMWWLIAAGMIAILLASGGLLFEYYTGARKVEH